MSILNDKIKVGDNVDYIFQGANPLPCVVKDTLIYRDKNYFILEAINLLVKSHIMVPIDQQEDYIRKSIS